MPVEDQLMVLLHYMGVDGSTSRFEQRNTFQIGYGTTSVVRDRVVEAILSLREKAIFWPSYDKKEIIKKDERWVWFPKLYHDSRWDTISFSI